MFGLVIFKFNQQKSRFLTDFLGKTRQEIFFEVGLQKKLCEINKFFLQPKPRH